VKKRTLRSPSKKDLSPRRPFFIYFAPMASSMKSENKLEGASNFRAWKTRIDLILAKNKVMDMVKGKIKNQKIMQERRSLKRMISLL
jgi:hypothetical protein